MITCKFEDQKDALLRHVTVGAIIVRDNKILLVKRSPNSLLEKNKYAIPGGFLDRDEDTQAAVRREVKEETGFETKEAKLFRIIDNPSRKGEDRQNVDFIFLLEVGEKTSEPDEEISETKWFDLSNLPNDEDIAFDHMENIKLYLKYLGEAFSLPVN